MLKVWSSILTMIPLNTANWYQVTISKPNGIHVPYIAKKDNPSGLIEELLLCLWEGEITEEVCNIMSHHSKLRLLLICSKTRASYKDLAKQCIMLKVALDLHAQES